MLLFGLMEDTHTFFNLELLLTTLLAEKIKMMYFNGIILHSYFNLSMYPTPTTGYQLYPDIFLLDFFLISTEDFWLIKGSQDWGKIRICLQNQNRMLYQLYQKWGTRCLFDFFYY